MWTPAGVAAGSPHGDAAAREWIESEKEHVAVAGWATLSAIISVRPDAELDLAELKSLLARVQREIHAAPNLVRYQMNGFVIAVGRKKAKSAAVTKFFDWAYSNGDGLARELEYIPLPDNVKNSVRGTWRSQVRG